MRCRDDARAGVDGQASIELVGLLPVAAAVVLGATQALLAGYAGELAGHAAEAAAIAVQRGEDPAAAARDALPGWGASRVRVDVKGRAVQVHLRPRAVVPPLADALVADRTADAGPPP